MQRFYTFFVAVMLAVVGFAQKTVTFKYEHPDHIKSIGDYWESYYIADDGTCTIPDGTYSFTIRTTDKAKITDVLIDEVSKFTASTPQTSFTVSYSDIEDGSVIEVITEANPVTIIRIKGNPEHLYLTKDYYRFEDVENVDGEWVIEDQELATYGVSVNAGYQITDVECNIAEDLGSVSTDKWAMPWQWTAGEEHVYTITTKSLDELRTLKMNVKVVGHPSKVSLFRYGTYSNPVLLEEGDNTVMFQESESPFRMEPAEYGSALYSVKFNGEPVEATGYGNNEYQLPAVDGDEVEVETEFPDIDIPVKFTFLNEGTEGCLAYVRINNQENLTPEVYLADDFTLKCGTGIYVSFNSSDYDIEEITFNDEIFTSYYGYSFFAIDPEGYEFVIDATAKPCYQIKVNCEDWEHVTYSLSYSSIYPLESESCVISVPPSTGSMSFAGMDDYDITEVVDVNNLGITSDWNPKQIYLYSVSPDDDIEVTVNTKYTERSQTATFYLQPLTEEDVEEGKEWWSTEIRLNYKETNFYKDIILKEGYNTVKFADSDNPVALYISPSLSYVYINGEKQEPTDSYSTAPSEVEIEDGDIVKLMYYDEIAEYDVVYAIDENADVKIFHDQVTEIANPDKHTVMEGTEIRLVFNEIPETEAYYYEHELKINGETVEFEDGEHVLTVMDHTNIEVKVNEFTGVENITTGTNVPADVYNLQGVRILNNATAEQIKALPAGIYVIGGEKKVIR